MIARAPAETADFLVLGSGIAGLRAAIALAPHGRVIVLTKSHVGAGSTGFAQGGIAAALGPDDSPALHAADTIRAGDGLCRPEAVEVLVSEGPRDVRELIDWGAAFDRAADGSLALAREGAHSVRRVLHARDATGREIARVLTERVRVLPSVEVRDHAAVVGLVIRDGCVAGARVAGSGGEIRDVLARATLLATGGAGQVYRETTNPSVACGDGITLAYLAGARVVDLEFVQFHPTVIDVPGAPRALLSEALRGEGAHLVNEQGERFMTRYDPAGDLAARDRVSRAILLERARTGGRVYLTMAGVAGDVRERFPQAVALCRSAGLDLATDRIPIGPAAHYVMGGVETDLDGRTSLPGLYAAGEVASTGVHGANRLASNSLLEGLVFGARAAAAMASDAISVPGRRGGAIADTAPVSDASPVVAPGITEPEVRDLMWDGAGVFRDRAGLSAVVERLDSAWRDVSERLAGGARFDVAGFRISSLATVARLIARAALRREETRGGHARTDFPERDDLHWTRHISEDREAL